MEFQHLQQNVASALRDLQRYRNGRSPIHRQSVHRRFVRTRKFRELGHRGHRNARRCSLSVGKASPNPSPEDFEA
ncbi:MAG TPA: hypothetical protein VKU38_14160 [Ktedonobacteraceae bacterium]|nr:hypothetical protein [Ktedonobacteraceae bacterium]